MTEPILSDVARAEKIILCLRDDPDVKMTTDVAQLIMDTVTTALAAVRQEERERAAYVAEEACNGEAGEFCICTCGFKVAKAIRTQKNENA
mgnify:CR=1 FL=1